MSIALAEITPVPLPLERLLIFILAEYILIELHVHLAYCRNELLDFFRRPENLISQVMLQVLAFQFVANIILLAKQNQLPAQAIKPLRCWSD